MTITLSYLELLPKNNISTQSLCILLHGYGADGSDLMPLAQELSLHMPHMAFISPHAPFPCDVGYGRQWFPLDTFIESYIQDGIATARPHIKHFIDKQSVNHGIPMEHIFLLGFSQGGIMALSIGLEDVCFGGLIGCSTAFIPPLSQHCCTQRIPVLLTHGSMDTILPVVPYYENSLQALKKIHNVKLTTLLRPSLGHGIDAECIQAICQFLSQYTR